MPIDGDLQDKEVIDGRGLISKTDSFLKGKTDSFTDCFLQGKTDSFLKRETAVTSNSFFQDKTDIFTDSLELRSDNFTRTDRLPDSSFLTPTRNATQTSPCPVERKIFEDGSKNTVRSLTIDNSGHDRFSVNSDSCCLWIPDHLKDL